MIPEEGVKSVLLRLRQLKDFMGTLDKVRESCQGFVRAETCDVVKGNGDDMLKHASKSFHFD